MFSNILELPFDVFLFRGAFEGGCEESNRTLLEKAQAALSLLTHARNHAAIACLPALFSLHQTTDTGRIVIHTHCPSTGTTRQVMSLNAFVISV